MNKTTEALKLAEEALEYHARPLCMCFAGCPDCDPIYAPDLNKALAAIREALTEPVCEHRIADARNEFVKDGYICIKCGALFRAADHVEPVKQEPVAWRCRYCNTDIPTEHASDCPIEICRLPNEYAAPVKREWVDLTEDEVNKLIQAWHKSDDGLFDYASAVIAAFKEKNK